MSTKRYDPSRGALFLLLIVLSLFTLRLLLCREDTHVAGTIDCLLPDGQAVDPESASAFQKLTLGIPIGLNSETETGLTAVPGIGPALAAAIVLEREKRGGFQSLEDLQDVAGINKRLLEKIRPFMVLR